jgi:hypothetical protein
VGYTYEDKVAAILAWSETTEVEIRKDVFKTFAELMEDGEDLSLGQMKLVEETIKRYKIETGDYLP